MKYFVYKEDRKPA